MIRSGVNENNELINSETKNTGADIGFAKPFGGTVIPPGYLYCDGSEVGRQAYDKLFAAIGTTWGEGDGVETFNIPDLRGIFVRCDGGENNAPMGERQEDATSVKGMSMLIQRSRSTSLPSVNSGNNHMPFNINGQGKDYAEINTHPDGALIFPITGAVETRPVNVAMKYCIRYE